MALAGPYTNSNYESDEGTIYPCKIQPETITTWNTEPTGTVDGKLFVKMSNGRRAYGISPRLAVLGIEVGTAPLQATKTIRVPVLSKAKFDALVVGTTYQYDGQDFKLQSKIKEAGRQA